ncbi:MAG: TIGR03545 family protein [Deltaproteobacteria bacterium]|nr:TIGR03545 family protein [Deltaproteobacteria bacterium]
MKKWIRWKGLLAFLCVGVLCSALWLLLIDGILERLIEKHGTEAVGAKVELGSADLSLFPAGLELSSLQITNPNAPMKNAVEISKINLSLETGNLLRRKIIIDDMALVGVRFDTPRKTSGAVGPKAGVAPETSTKKEATSKLGLPDLKIPSVDEILEKEDLKTIALAKSIQSDIQSEKEKWQKILSELPNKEKFAEYQSRIKQATSGKKGGFAGILGSAGEIPAVQKDVQRDIDRLKEAREEFNRKLSSFKGRVAQLKKAPLEDIERLKKKYALSPQNLANLSRLLLGNKVSEWSQKAIAWYERIKPILERRMKKDKGPDVTKPARGPGINVRFKEQTPLPDFLIRQAIATIQLGVGDLTGKIQNITPEQHILGVPLTFAFAGEKMKGVKSVSIDGTLDHIAATRSKDLVKARILGYEIKDVTLSERSDWPIILKNALTDLNIDGVLEGSTLAANLTAGLNQVKLSTSTVSGKDAGLLANAIGSALSSVSEFTATADIKGTIDNYKVDIKSDLDSILKDAAGNALEKEQAKLEQSLKKAIYAKVDGPLNQTDSSLGSFGNIGGNLTDRLNLGNGLLGKSKLPF